ncbi:hypothetical protein, partial [Bacteroides stercoris]|uniref:hypothetical protein n=1 Tax=Bacteroides stercoris TaxID=46506 RepID=UPI00192410C3
GPRAGVARNAGRRRALLREHGRPRGSARADETTATARRERASRAVIERASLIATAIAEKATTNWGDLLHATFALPSGERVTWAAATIEQHEARATSLEVMAAGDLQTAALHREAVSTIRGAHTHNLADAVS